MLIARMRSQPSGLEFLHLDAALIGRRRRRHADAGAIDQNVEPPERRHDLIDGTAAGLRLRNVERKFFRRVGEWRLGDQPREAAVVDVDRRDFRAGASERARHHAAHAAGRAGDHRDAAVENLRHKCTLTGVRQMISN